MSTLLRLDEAHRLFYGADELQAVYRDGEMLWPWTPQVIFTPGVMGGWYDVNILGSLFQERSGAGVTPAELNGVVGMVRDQSGNGNHVYAPSDAGRPILRQDSVGYYLEFDGVDDTMISSATFKLNVPSIVAAAFAMSTPNAIVNGLYGFELGNAGRMSISVGDAGGGTLRSRAIYSGNLAMDLLSSALAAGLGRTGQDNAAIMWASPSQLRVRYFDNSEHAASGTYVNASAATGARIRFHGVNPVSGKARAMVAALDCSHAGDIIAKTHLWAKRKSGLPP